MLACSLCVPRYKVPAFSTYNRKALKCLIKESSLSRKAPLTYCISFTDHGKKKEKGIPDTGDLKMRCTRYIDIVFIITQCMYSFQH